MSEISLSAEQDAILDHPIAHHARILAGPGTGKSFTATLWLGKLHSDGTSFRSKMLTFTRAATKEFASKLEDAGLTDSVGVPATVHSHALSVLMSMSGHGLPEPLRIPDSWEARELVHPHLSLLLKSQGFDEATPRFVREVLEREMAAGWQRLDDSDQSDEVSPQLRTAYLAAWGWHRQVFGYSLLAELSYRAAIALEDMGEDHRPNVDLLLVDEYQDLNAADIKLIAAHAQLGIAVVAIGDDDQSIYSWRRAHPQGIRQFCDDFVPNSDYTLSISRRCGRTILAAATELIQTAPGRPQRPELTAHDGAPEGLFAYVRFKSNKAEARAVARIAASRASAGVSPDDILVLVRSQADKWRGELQESFEAEGLSLASVDWVESAISAPALRLLIALGRLAEDPTDSLAWWGLTQGLTAGVGPTFTQHVLDNLEKNERFGAALLRLRTKAFPGLNPAVAARVSRTIDAAVARTADLNDELQQWRDAYPDEPWSSWFLGEATNVDWRDGLSADPLSAESARLVTLVGPALATDATLAFFLSQLEPLGKELAANEAGGVRLMNYGQSKGLTVNTAIVVGVEDGLVPLGRADDEDEERRLLYVAMTRATHVCVATYTNRRQGPLARSGGGQAQTQRSRCPFFVGLSYGDPEDGDVFLDNLTRVRDA